MPDDTSSEDSPPRRRFLRRLTLATGAGALLAGCGGGDGSTSSDSASTASAGSGGENQCVPPSELSKKAKQGRQRYSYVAQTPESDKQCDNCQFWIPAKGDETCGGCRLFAGPVHPEGYCTAYLRG